MPKSREAPALPRYLPTLDGVRGLAILLVLTHNFRLLDGARGAFGSSLESMLDVGWIGVQLFFVLSGFLITRILLDTQDAPNYFRAFYMRRVLRIFPLYYAMLAITFVILPALGAQPPSAAAEAPHQIWYWLYLSNWAEPFGLSDNALPHFWSLAIEEQFYLLWPFLVHRRTAPQVFRLCISIAIVGLVSRLGMLWSGVSADTVYVATVGRMDALAIGSAVAALLRMPSFSWRVLFRKNLVLGSAFAVGISGSLVSHDFPASLPFGPSFGYSFLAVMFAGLILAAVAADRNAAKGWASLLRFAPLRALGKYSYALYVIHEPMHQWIGIPLLKQYGLDNRNSPALAIAYIIVMGLVCFGLAMLSYHLFERKFLALKRYFEPSTGSPATVPGRD